MRVATHGIDGYFIAATATIDEIIPLTGGDDIVARLTEYLVCAIPAVQGVIAVLAE